MNTQIFGLLTIKPPRSVKNLEPKVKPKIVSRKASNNLKNNLKKMISLSLLFLYTIFRINVYPTLLSVFPQELKFLGDKVKVRKVKQFELK